MADIMRIEQSAFPTAWSAESIEQQISNARAIFLVAQAEKGIAGFSLNWIVADEVHMLKFAVDLRYRRRGIGRLLFESTCEAAIPLKGRIIWLEVRDSNTAAQDFYKAMGFQTIGRRKGYYGDTGEDALVMFNKIGGV